MLIEVVDGMPYNLYAEMASMMVTYWHVYHRFFGRQQVDLFPVANVSLRPPVTSTDDDQLLKKENNF